MPPQRPLFIQSLVATTLRTGGATADISRRRLLPPEDRWYFPRFPDLTRILPLTGLETAFGSFISAHLPAFDDTVLFGAWINTADRTCYLDLITPLAHRGPGRSPGQPVRT